MFPYPPLFNPVGERIRVENELKMREQREAYEPQRTAKPRKPVLARLLRFVRRPAWRRWQQRRHQPRPVTLAGRPEASGPPLAEPCPPRITGAQAS